MDETGPDNPIDLVPIALPSRAGGEGRHITGKGNWLGGPLSAILLHNKESGEGGGEMRVDEEGKSSLLGHHILLGTSSRC